MLDKNIKSESEGIDELRHHARSMTGMNFALAMRDHVDGDDDRITVYPRENQPCQGGEMRKYGKRSPNRPKDPRPGDLHDPFPDGILEGVSIHWQTLPKKDMIEFLTSQESPYRKGVGPNTEHILDETGERVVGSIFLDTDVDPTVFVNMLQFIRSIDSNLFKKYRENGLTGAESILCMMLCGSDPEVAFTGTYSYYFPTKASVRWIIEGDHFDLSGGTYRDGYDYNRPEVQDLFKARGEEVVTKWYDKMIENGAVKTIETPLLQSDGTPYLKPSGQPYVNRNIKAESFKEYCQIAKKVIEYALRLEKARVMIDDAANEALCKEVA
jgi:hypothetical protein